MGSPEDEFERDEIEVQHEVTLIAIALQAQADGLELECELIAEGAIEPEVSVLGTQCGADRAQDREHRRLLAAQLFGKPLVGLAHRSTDAVCRYIEACQGVEVLERLSDGCDQQHPAVVQRVEAE